MKAKRNRKFVVLLLCIFFIESVMMDSLSVIGYADNTVSNAWTWVKDTADEVVDEVEETGNKVKDTAVNVGNKTKEAASDVGKKTKEKATEVGGKIKNTASDVGNKTKDKVADIGEKTKDKATQIGAKTSEIKNSAANKTNQMIDSVTESAQKAKESVKSFVTNIDIKKFTNGWDYAKQYAGVALSGLKARDYMNSVKESISDMTENINGKYSSRYTQSNASVAGFLAEDWHSYTYNIDATAAGKNTMAKTVESNGFGSVDVSVGDKYEASLKYYKNGTESAKAQAESFMQRYQEECAKLSRNGKDIPSMDEYFDQRGLKSEQIELYRSIYTDQTRIIPSDQMEEAKEYLRRKIAKESNKSGVNRPKIANSTQETLDLLADRISTDGAESIPLSNKEAQAIAELAVDGEFDPSDFGVKPSTIVKPRYIMKQAMGAGIESATLEAALTIGPEVYKIISQAIKEGKIDEKKLKEAGIEGAIAGGEGFVEGAISSAVYLACASGKLGSGLTDASPDVIGTLTVIMIDAAKYGYKLAHGEITEDDYGDLMAQEVFVAALSTSSGLILQFLLPAFPVAYMAGSMAGSLFAAAAYETGKEIIMTVKGAGGFEVLLPQAIDKGVKIGTEVVADAKLKERASEFKDAVITTASNGVVSIRRLIK